MTDHQILSGHLPGEIDVHAIRAYSADPCPVDALPLALFLLFLSLVTFAFEGANNMQLLAGIALAVAGIGQIGHMLYRRVHPSSPMYVLSPSGVTLNLGTWTHVMIPWGTIEGVGRADPQFFYPSLVRPRTIRFRNVTTVVVPRAFYDAHIHIDSLFKRGPGWSLNFMPGGDTVEVAIHHEVIGEDAETLRREIEARWQALRESARGVTSSGIPQISERPAPRLKPCSLTNAKVTSLAGIALLVPGILVLFTNVVGLWQTEGQKASRRERAEFRKMLDEADRKAAEELRRQEDISRRLRKEMKDW